MQLINAYFGTTLLESVEFELATNRGDRFDVCVGYAKNLTAGTFERFGNALESWLAGNKERRFRLFIGDHRRSFDSPDEQLKKIKECTKLAADLISYSRSVEEQMEVVFLERLHAKFYSMWSINEAVSRLEWAIVGSSNLTDAALAEKNIELDIYLPYGDSHLSAIQSSLATVLDQTYLEGASWGDLHDEIDRLTAKSRWENDKLRAAEEEDAEVSAAIEAEECRQMEEQARLESDKALGISGSD